MGFITFNKLLERLKNNFQCNNKIPIQLLSISMDVCSGQTNNMINKLHERVPRIVLNNHVSDFEALLHKSSDICSHHRNIQMLI